MAWGLVPGVLTMVLFASAAIVIASQLVDWSEAIANALVSQDGSLNTVVQVVAAVAIVLGAVVLGAYTFTVVTLTLGQFFFERISRAVDETHGVAGTDSEEPWYRSLGRGLGEVVRIALLTIPLAVGLFVLGLVPVIGGFASFVLGMSFGGWFLALELTAYPLERRGFITLAQRREALGKSRPTVVGFGIAVFLTFLIPLGPAVFMPAAVAGATRLVHDTADTAPVTP